MIFSSRSGKSIVAALWFALSTAAMAGSGSQAGSANNGTLVYFNEFPRSQVFSGHRHAISASGEILVCLQPVSTQDGKCQDEKGFNAWQHLAASAPAGYRVAAYQWSMPSKSAGTVYRWLIVYYSKVN